VRQSDLELHLKTADFDYDLPSEFIAQTPVEPRDASRLLVLHRNTGQVEHHLFRDLGGFLRPGDLLILNETRVIPARLYARKIPTGGRVEFLLLRRQDDITWEALVGGKGLASGKRVQLEDGPTGEIVEDLSGPRRLVQFSEPLEPLLDQIGHVPLPPYIHTPLEERERYQTVYAQVPGSAAAPTAGLHFTPGLIKHLQSQGVKFASVILHVGLDTFAPVNEPDPREHEIHTEWCQLTPDVADLIRHTKQTNGRIVAVGTTSVRTLESASRGADAHQVVVSLEGPTDLFILPGYEFQVVDAMITNFHLPRSTLVMLVSAFAGSEEILAAYEIAKQKEYRFYSFGDAMLIL
jgi:S-adenosylmethionine:tRNA ribosyltransferase-isomerase